jgi:predicted NAD/FAD-binding protein
VTPDWSAFLPGFAAAFDSAHLLAQLVCLLVRAESYLRSGDAAGKTLGEFLSSRGFSERFKAALFYPMFSIVCTCSYSSVDKYPASVALEYFARHGVLNWPWAKTCQCRVRGGVRCIAQTLAKHVPRVHLGVKIRGVFTATKAQVGANSRTTKDSATPGKPVVAYEVAPSDGDDSDPQRQRHVWEAFDHVIVATQAHQALELLLSPPQDQLETEPVKHNMTADDRVEQIPRLDAYKNALGHFKYERSRVVVHCDPRLMPSSRRQWAPLNILVPGVSAPASTANASAMPMCSVWMTRIDDRVSPNVYQTWNPIIEPQGTTFADGHFDRPVMSLGTLKCLAELDELQGECGIHFVGAYALHAVPLLESGVRSAMRAVTRVDANCQIPWEDSDSSSLVPGKKEENDLSKTVAIGSFPWSMKVILGIAAAGFAYAQTQALRQK